MLQPYKGFVKTITTGNGVEFACHERITASIGANSILQIPIPHGKKVSSKMQMGLSDNTYPNRRVFTKSHSRKLHRLWKNKQKTKKKTELLCTKRTIPAIYIVNLRLPVEFTVSQQKSKHFLHLACLKFGFSFGSPYLCSSEKINFTKHIS
jgi:hypothetical protein